MGAFVDKCKSLFGRWQKWTKVDLTKGNILRGMLIFMIPLLIGNFFQQAYSIIDSIIVGQQLGDDAFAAVGMTGAASFLILGFASGLAGGLSVLIAQYFGSNDKDSLRKSLAISIFIGLVATIVLTVIGLFCIDPLLELTGMEPKFRGYARDYMIPVFAGLGAMIFYNLLSNSLRSIGDSSTPLYFLILTSVLNVAFDYWFIMGFNMGTFGAGLATIISQVISVILCLVYMFYRYPFMRIKLSDFKMDWGEVWEHVRISIPMAIQFSIVGIGLMAQQQGATYISNAWNESMGLVETDLLYGLYTKAYSFCGRIDSFTNIVILAIGSMMATFAGQNYGAGDLERVKKGFKTSFIMAFSVIVVMAAFVVPLTPMLLRIFVPEEAITPELEQACLLYIGVQQAFYFFLVTIYILRSSLQGFGKSWVTIVVSITELAMRIGASLVLARFGGWLGLSFSNPIAWIAASIVLISFTIFYMKKFNIEYRNGTFGLEKKEQSEEATS